MIFERAIDDAPTMFLFDKRSQQKLQEMAMEAPAGSRDRSLILLTQAAFAWYNSVELPGADVLNTMRQVQAILREVKQFKEDRVFTTLALKLEVDMLLQSAAMLFLDAEKSNRQVAVLTEEDVKAQSICETLLRNLPINFDPLPSTWYTSLVPLFPTFKAEMLEFYSQRGRDHRSEPLAKVLKAVKQEIITAAGIVQTKKFISENRIPIRNRHALRTMLLANVRDVGAKILDGVPPALTLVSDIMLPRGISHPQMDTAAQNVMEQIDNARQQKDVRRYTTGLLQLGILNFLREDPEEAVKALVQTLRASQRISPEDKKVRQYRHEEFPDIPFMIGTSFLRMSLANKGQMRVQEKIFLGKSMTGLMQALSLQPQYHHAFVNLLLAVRLDSNSTAEEELLRMYLSQFQNDIANLNGLAFRNLALAILQNNQQVLSPEAVRLMILASFCQGGELTKARKMLQELKTLYVLNAHDHSAAYLDIYRNSLRMKDAEFIKDLEDSGVHSALLFYIAHAYTSLALAPGKYDNEINLDYSMLNQGIELNTESLFFNAKNSSSLRLVDTQVQVLQFAVQRSEKRWETITSSMGQRFQYYEDYLRQEKSHKLLKERLGNLQLGALVPDLKIAQSTLIRMDGTISSQQRDRLRQRVMAT